MAESTGSASSGSTKKTSAKKTSAKKTSAKKSSGKNTSSSGGAKKTSSSGGAKKTSAKKTSATKSSSSSSGSRTAKASTSPSRSRSSKQSVGAATVAKTAAEQLAAMTGRDVEGVSAVERTDDGWRVELDVVELRRVPATTDVLASYDVQLDESGELMGYRRLRRFGRGKLSEDGSR